MNAFVLAALAAFTACAGTALAQNKSDPDFWREQTWQKKFLGLYGVLSDVEPEKVTDPAGVEMQQAIKAFFEKSDKVGAMRALEKFITKDSNPSFNFMLGMLYSELGRAEEGIAQFRTAIRKFDNFRRAHEAVGQMLLMRQKPADALPHLTRALELGGKDAILYGALGYCQLSLEQFVSAETAFRNALLFAPAESRWKSGLAEAIGRQGKHAESAALFGELINANQREAKYWDAQTAAYLALKETAKARQNIEIMQSLGIASARNLVALGRLYLAEENLFDAAVKAFESACEKEGATLEMKPLLDAVDLMARRGGYEPARQLLARIKATALARLSAPEKKQLQKSEAFIASTTGAGPEFVKILEEIISDDPVDGAAIINLARHYEKEGSAESLARASDWYERAEALADLAAKDPAALTEPGAKDRAERMKNEAAEAALRHGFMLNKMGQVAKAVDKLKRSGQLKPRDDLRDILAKLEKQALKEKADAEARQAKLQRDSEARP